MKKQGWLVLAAVIGMAGALSACDTKKVFGCLPTDDPWKHPPGTRDAINDLNVKPYLAFAPVPEEKFDHALVMLKKTTFLPIKTKDLVALNVTAPANAAGMTPYLMRAVSTHDDKGSYAVAYMEDHVWVRFVPDVHDPCAKVAHDAVVVWLPAPPISTFTTLSVTP